MRRRSGRLSWHTTRSRRCTTCTSGRSAPTCPPCPRTCSSGAGSTVTECGSSSSACCTSSSESTTRRSRSTTRAKARSSSCASSAIAVDERKGAAPRVLGGVRELLLLTVEEAVRRARVGHDLVLDAGRGQRLVEGGVVLGGDVLVVACLEGEDRRLHFAGALDRARRLPASGLPVEPDRALEPMTAGCREP